MKDRGALSTQHLPGVFGLWIALVLVYGQLAARAFKTRMVGFGWMTGPLNFQLSGQVMGT